MKSHIRSSQDTFTITDILNLWSKSSDALIQKESWRLTLLSPVTFPPIIWSANKFNYYTWATRDEGGSGQGGKASTEHCLRELFSHTFTCLWARPSSCLESQIPNKVTTVLHSMWGCQQKAPAEGLCRKHSHAWKEMLMLWTHHCCLSCCCHQGWRENKKRAVKILHYLDWML